MCVWVQDRGALLNFRAFSFPPGYDYDALTAPVLVVAGAWVRVCRRRGRGEILFIYLFG